MKIIMLIIDGAVSSDYSSCENIEYIKKCGEYKIINNTPKGLEANSLNCTMNMLGVEKNLIPSGRAYLEALAINAKIDKEDLIFRCNNVDINKGLLKSSCSKNIEIPKSLGKDIKIIKMNQYKNLLILKGYKKFKEDIISYPPHENIGKNIKEIMIKCKDEKIQKVLNDLIIKYSLFPWDASIKEEVLSFEEIHSLKGAVVCKAEIIKGIGRAMKMYVPEIKNTTADIDTDLIGKGKEAIKLIKNYDFVLLHVNGADESAHRRNNYEKKNFIKKIDKELIKYLIENKDKDTSLIVTSDHGTCSITGKHINDMVDYYILDRNGAVIYG